MTKHEKLTKGQIKNILNCHYNLGWTVDKIQRKMGISTTTIYKYLKINDAQYEKFDLPPRKIKAKVTIVETGIPEIIKVWGKKYKQMEEEKS